MKNYVKEQKNIKIFDDSVIEIIVENNEAKGIITVKNKNIFSKSVICQFHPFPIYEPQFVRRIVS